MLRRSRHRVGRAPRDSQFTIDGTPQALDTVQVFNHFRLVPFNWLHELVPGSGTYAGHRNLCGRMKDEGILRTQVFHPGLLAETLTFSRLEGGERFLKKYNRPVFSEYNKSTDEEQLLIDMIDMQFVLGARKTDVEVNLWHSLATHPKTPELPANAFRFYIGKNKNNEEMFFVPDGHPFYMKRDGRSILFLKEVVRTNKTRAVIKHKAELYKQFEQDIKNRYGFTALMVLWIATSERDRDNILRWIKEAIGPCQWMLVAFTQDPTQARLSTFPVTTHLFDQPWQRPGYPDFSLATLSEV